VTVIRHAGRMSSDQGNCAVTGSDHIARLWVALHNISPQPDGFVECNQNVPEHLNSPPLKDGSSIDHGDRKG
jgi:hypothetical protein